VVVVVDQAAKALVSAHLVPGQSVAVLGPLELTLAHNRGVAFGLASGGGALLVLFTVVALAVSGVAFARRATQRGMWVAFGLLAGGALGNVADRLRTGVVTDFIHVLSWPPFNLADVAITVGVAIFVGLYLAPAESRDG
jgi:signal peptidase II